MSKIGSQKKRIIGLDCHPDTFVAAIITGTRPENAQIEKVTDSLELNKLEDWFSKNDEDQIDAVLLEASANSFAIFDRLTALGLEVFVLESETVSRLQKEVTTTDKTSAVGIAKVFLSGLSDKVWVPDPTTRDRRKVLCCYRQAQTDQTRANNRIKSMLNEHTIRLAKGTRLTTEKGRKLVFAAREWSTVQYGLLEQAFLDLNRAAEKTRLMRRMMAQEIMDDPTMFSLVRIYGLRHITVYALVAMIGTVKRFANPKKLASYLGVSPSLKESGTSVHKKNSKRNGRGDIRPLLVQAAQSVLNRDSASNPMHKWSIAVMMRRGRSCALIAAARKIVTSVWYVLNGKAIAIEKEEERKSLYIKLRHLLTELGSARVRKMGYKTYDECIEEKIKLLDVA